MRRIPERLVVAVLVIATLGLSACDSEGTAGTRDVDGRETVLVLHGLARTKSSMWLLASQIEKAGFNVVRIGYPSLNVPPEEIVASVSQQINDCCAESASRVHFVGHSLGGLIIRAYLAEHTVPALGRVVLIATPNAGTPLVDAYRDTWWMGLAGPTAQNLGTDADSFPKSLPPPYYPVGVIAGIGEVPWLKDQIPGKDDGLVALESTRVAGMVDFIAIESSHIGLRYNSETARQTIAFLRTGKFERDTK